MTETVRRTAVRLIYGGLALHVVGLVALFLGHDRVRETTEAEHPTWTDTQISDEVLAHSVGTAVYGVLLVVLWLWLADKLEAGRAWARNAITGLAVVGAGGGLRMLTDPAFPLGIRVAFGVGAGLGVAAAAWLWTDRGFPVKRAARA